MLFTVCLAAELASFICNFAGAADLCAADHRGRASVSRGLVHTALLGIAAFVLYALLRRRYGRPVPRRATSGEADSTA